MSLYTPRSDDSCAARVAVFGVALSGCVGSLHFREPQGLPFFIAKTLQDRHKCCKHLHSIDRDPKEILLVSK